MSIMVMERFHKPSTKTVPGKTLISIMILTINHCSREIQPTINISGPETMGKEIHKTYASKERISCCMSVREKYSQPGEQC